MRNGDNAEIEIDISAENLELSERFGYQGPADLHVQAIVEWSKDGAGEYRYNVYDSNIWATWDNHIVPVRWMELSEKDKERVWGHLVEKARDVRLERCSL